MWFVIFYHKHTTMRSNSQFVINPLTAGAEYIRVFIFCYHINYHLLKKLKIKCKINQQYLNIFDLHFVKSDNFHSLEVVDRVSETQLQVGENSDWIIWRIKG